MKSSECRGSRTEPWVTLVWRGHKAEEEPVKETKLEHPVKRGKSEEVLCARIQVKKGYQGGNNATCCL